MNEAWITWIIQGITGLAIGIIGWYMKRDRDALDKKIEKQGDRISQLEKDMKQMPFVYTTREDFLRAITSLESNIKSTETKLDNKLDKVLDRLAKMKEEA